MSTWRGLRLEHAHAAAVPREPLRVARPVAQVDRRTERGDAPHTRVTAPTPSASAPPTPVPAIHTPPPSPSAATCVDREAEVGVPATDREVAVRSAGPAEVEREHPPSGLGRDAVGELGERESGRQRAARRRREVVAQHQPGRGAARRRPRPVRGEHGAVGCVDRQVHGAPRRGSPLSWRLVTATTLPVPAFKEWAVVVRALLEGEQILDVRKGGLREEGRHFSVQSSRVWLYPDRRAPGARARQARLPALDRHHRGRGAARPRHPGGGLGRHRGRRHRHRARACSTRSTARSCGRGPTSRRGTAGRRAIRCTCSRCGCTGSPSRSQSRSATSTAAARRGSTSAGLADPADARVHAGALGRRVRRRGSRVRPRPSAVSRRPSSER